MDKKSEYVIGIDEAGRGPIAGPVAVGGVMIRTDILQEMEQSHFFGIRDSKKLTEKKREEWFARMHEWKREQKIAFTVALISGEEIDARGIAPSIRKGIAGVLKKLDAHTTAKVLLDGGIHAPIEFVDQQTIIKGDEKEAIIALASIAAKVTRDRKMTLLDEEFPAYGFAAHKGYGTKAHYEALTKHGTCSIHRKSFLTSFFNTK